MTYTPESAKEKLSTLNGWTFENNSIEKKFVFKNFREAMSFMVRASYICESMNHHPDWSNVYNTVSIRLNTHDAGGVVTEKDRKLALAIDALIK